MTGHTEQARIFYEKALPYLILAKARDEEADTRNNLSFVLGILGEFDYALTEVEAALEIRLLSKQRFPIALSYNTRGLLLAEMGHLERAQRDCQRALQIFQEVESSDTPRGTGLASDSLGHIFRLQGKKWQEGEIVLQEAEFLFRRSEELLIQAEEIFSQKVKEPLREWDAYDKRGHLYYDWGICLTHFGKSDGRKYLEKSLFYYNKALELARQSRQLFQTADAMNDIKIVQESMSQS
jgi:tetratricopeptide (TPR) repeat protein